ncbi:MAG: histidine phosphatase family protein [Parachlamydia sp.]|nr:MAG: histidine phosphatase family protein [Parachlamydia sp.]
MIFQKEFYFVRHGQTDHNILEGENKGDHPEDIPLNETGKNQAKLIEPLISSLQIKTVCSSPLKRVQETKAIITSNLQVDHYEIHDLRECSAQIWKEMSQAGMYSSLPNDGPARQFMNRVRNGVNQALALPGPSLIVAHGGIHWALCCLMGINEHEWAIHNCIPIYFSVRDDGKWIAQKLT